MTQTAELWFPGDAAVDFEQMGSALRRRLGQAIDETEIEGGRMYGHRDHIVQYEEGHGPAVTAILPQPSATPESCVGEVQQSWRCPNAQELIERGRSSMVIVEMMTSKLPVIDRVRLFHSTLEAALQASEAEAIVFRSSQQVVSREDYLGDLELEPVQRAGAVNVRMFGVEGEHGSSTVMDTRGLEALGLHDVQCHFRDLQPQDVARVLFNVSYYLIEKGAVIEDGNTVSGIGDDQQWSCRFETSLAAPQRRILDLNPGEPFAAGEREPAQEEHGPGETGPEPGQQEPDGTQG